MYLFLKMTKFAVTNSQYVTMVVPYQDTSQNLETTKNIYFDPNKTTTKNPGVKRVTEK